MTTFVNLTPHAITLNDGTTFPPSGTVARVEQFYHPFNSDKVTESYFGTIEGLPAIIDGETIFIVSMIVAQTKGHPCVVAPATNHPQAIRDEKGHIISVPGFIYF